MPDLGWAPLPGYDVNLVAGNDFVCTGSPRNGSPLPAGAVVTLTLDAGAAMVSWPATVAADGSSFAWHVPSETVDAAIAALNVGGRVTAQILYTDASGLDLTWTTGKVRFA